MPNNYFQFKQFKVVQDQCAMKVTTDACLFGAWVAYWLQTQKPEVGSIADAGAGTGLLSLLLAQKTKAQIEAFELDDIACKQCVSNFAESPWPDRLSAFNYSVHSLEEQAFDLTIANPPFFVHHLQSNNPTRNKALHATNAELKEWANSLHQITKPTGYIALLLPPNEADEFILQMQQYKRHLQYQVCIKHSNDTPPLRYILLFDNSATAVHSSSIVIKENNNYTIDFIELLKEYYLYL